MSQFTDHIQFVIGLFAMMDPVSVVPLMLSLTVSATAQQRRATVFAATATILVILLGAQYSGIWFLGMLGTSLASLEVAGGFVIAWTGFAMLTSADHDSSPFPAGKGASALQLGIVPLAVPMMAGPGAITKVLLESQPGHGVDSQFHVTLIIISVCLACGLILLAGGRLGSLLGRGVVIVFNRLFGLVVLAIGIEIMAAGIGVHVGRMLG